MNKTIAVFFTFIFCSFGANATIMYEYDISDTAWADFKSTPTFGNGDRILFLFADGTDFAMLTNSDLIGAIWSIQSLSPARAISGPPIYSSDATAAGFFSWDGSDLSLTVGESAKDASISFQSTALRSLGQVGQNAPLPIDPDPDVEYPLSLAYVYPGAPDGGPSVIYATSFFSSHEFIGNRTPTGVSEPPTIALLGFGLLGLGFARHLKVQS